MKKIISTILVCVLLLGCVMSFASCGKLLVGKYSAEVDARLAGGEVTYEFTAFKYKKTTTSEVVGFAKETVVEGDFEIGEDEDGELVIVFTYEAEDGTKKTETYAFSEGEENGVKYVKIGIIKYNKAE